MPPGNYWCVPVIDRQDGNGTVKPPLVWFDSLTTSPRARQLSAADMGLPELPLLKYQGELGAWQPENAHDVQFAPAVYTGE